MEEDAEGMDRLDMDGDFLGGRSGRDGEFYYEGCRQRALQTRDDALYGVFAEGHSDYDYEEDEGSRRRKRRRDESESDFTRPVQFVSKGMPEGVEQKEQRSGLGQVASSLRTAAAEDDQQERVASLVREKEKVAKQDALQKHQLQVMETIAGVLEQVWVEDTAGLLMLRGLLKTFQELKLRHEEEFKMCSVAWIACRFAHPLLIRVFQGWQPLQNPLFGLEVMSSWKYLLQCDQPYDFSDATESMAPYVQLVSEVIMPAVRISGTNSWEARDPEPMLCFLKSWERLLPPVVLHSILEHVIMPKLTAAVESWDPRREKVPIHVWVHPWLPTLGRRIETLCDSIRYKLSQRRRTKKN